MTKKDLKVFVKSVMDDSREEMVKEIVAQVKAALTPHETAPVTPTAPVVPENASEFTKFATEQTVKLTELCERVAKLEKTAAPSTPETPAVTDEQATVLKGIQEKMAEFGTQIANIMTSTNRPAPGSDPAPVVTQKAAADPGSFVGVWG